MRADIYVFAFARFTSRRDRRSPPPGPLRGSFAGNATRRNDEIGLPRARRGCFRTSFRARPGRRSPALPVPHPPPPPPTGPPLCGHEGRNVFSLAQYRGEECNVKPVTSLGCDGPAKRGGKKLASIAGAPARCTEMHSLRAIDKSHFSFYGARVAHAMRAERFKCAEYFRH